MADAGVALRVRVGSSRVTSCLIINKSLEALVPLSASITYITLILFNRHDCSPLERASERRSERGGKRALAAAGRALLKGVTLPSGLARYVAGRRRRSSAPAASLSSSRSTCGEEGVKWDWESGNWNVERTTGMRTSMDDPEHISFA